MNSRIFFAVVLSAAILSSAAFADNDEDEHGHDANGNFEAYFDASAGNAKVTVGSQAMLLLTIKNLQQKENTFNFRLSGVPPKISYWSWFNGHRYDSMKDNMNLTVGPGKSVVLGVVVFGGGPESGKLNVTVTLEDGNSHNHDNRISVEKPVDIVYSSSGLLVQTSEFGWIAFVILGLIATAVFYFNTKPINKRYSALENRAARKTKSSKAKSQKNAAAKTNAKNRR